MGKKRKASRRMRLAGKPKANAIASQFNSVRLGDSGEYSSPEFYFTYRIPYMITFRLPAVQKAALFSDCRLS